jgi:predicted N-acetyltransferase YhbS
MSLAIARPTGGATFFRHFNSDADWWAIRALLVRTHANTAPNWNWDIRRWDGRRRDDPDRLQLLCERIGLWERDGSLVGAVHPEGPGDVLFELDPDFRDVLPAMIVWAEESLAIERDGRPWINTFVLDYDLTRSQALAQRGWTPTAGCGWIRVVRLSGWRAPDAHVAAPYDMRTTSPLTIDSDAARMADLLNAAFRRTLHSADEYLRFVRRSPSFDHELNLVAQAPDGHLAAHVGVTYDAENRFGIFEPVCTHPDDQRHGLARALMFEGMRRLTALGATHAIVETGEMTAANALYRACGFTEEYAGHWWEREL